jgi:hypothetical protein
VRAENKKPPKFANTSEAIFFDQFFRSVFLAEDCFSDSLAGSAVTLKSNFRKLLQDRILKSLGRPQTNHGLGLDLDGFASLRIAAHARLAVRFHDAADSWNDELARGALGFFHRKLVQLFKKECRLLLGCAELFGDVRNDLGLAEWLSCHLVCLSSCRILSVPGNPGGPQNFFVYPEKWAKKLEPTGL